MSIAIEETDRGGRPFIGARIQAVEMNKIFVQFPSEIQPEAPLGRELTGAASLEEPVPQILELEV